ncbi:MAG: hypothetical protein AB1664_24075 [Thermodesulfobacteriota bacterium]
MDFQSREEFELHVHKCFGRIFELLTKADGVIKEAADKEEAEGKYGVMSDLRDWVEETILYCHLAWQYHRLAASTNTQKTWDSVERATRKDSEIQEPEAARNPGSVGKSAQQVKSAPAQNNPGGSK